MIRPLGPINPDGSPVEVERHRAVRDIVFRPCSPIITVKDWVIASSDRVMEHTRWHIGRLGLYRETRWRRTESRGTCRRRH